MFPRITFPGSCDASIATTSWKVRPPSVEIATTTIFANPKQSVSGLQAFRFASLVEIP